ncbi:hypothetical protein HI914_05142 [Erysiphe necator]|nr:hypothetical protein HI914_05142 [Erysiphe necator]
MCHVFFEIGDIIVNFEITSHKIIEDSTIDKPQYHVGISETNSSPHSVKSTLLYQQSIYY